MNLPRLALRTALRYRRHLGLLALGIACACAVVTGSLVVGDSVRATLLRNARRRLGRVSHALRGRRARLRASLARSLTRDGMEAAAVLRARAAVTADASGRRVNLVRVLGVDGDFWRLGPTASRVTEPGLHTGEALINRALARRLEVGAGDTVMLRLAREADMLQEFPLVRVGRFLGLRVRVRAVLDSARFGDFSLAATQVAPYNVFLDREWLAGKLRAAGRCNLLLVAARTGQGGETTAAERISGALAAAWTPEDAGLRLRRLPGTGWLELTHAGVFLSERVARAVLAAGHGARGVFGYFVNSIEHGGRSCPYSFVAGVADGVLPPAVPVPNAGELIAGEWLAHELRLRPGAEVRLRYYAPRGLRRLVELDTVLRVRAVIRLVGQPGMRELAPVFPGLADAGDCRAWDKSLPIDLGRVRPRDEDYWRRYGPTPKALLALGTAQNLWRARLGTLTAVRYPVASNREAQLRRDLARRVSPAVAGVACDAVRARVLAGAADAVDFGQLFLGLSFFLLVGGIMLAGLLLALFLAARASQSWLLRAVGLGARQVTGFWLMVVGAALVPGVLLGTGLGVLYARGLIWALGHVWRGVTQTSAIAFAPAPASLALAPALTLAAGFAGALYIIHRANRMCPRPLPAAIAYRAPASGRLLSLGACACALLGGVLLKTAGASGPDYAIACLLAGALLLAAGMLFCARCLWAGAGRTTLARRLTLPRLAAAGTCRRPGRSLAVIGLLALAVFLLCVVYANRVQPVAGERAGGTGGFALYGQTSLPLPYDLARADARRRLGLRGLDDCDFVQLRARAGDEASCLNLNRVLRPRILGVEPGALDRRAAFSFVACAPGLRATWQDALGAQLGPGRVPVVADQAVITWSLKSKIGDGLTVVAEDGRRVELVFTAALRASVFQGGVLMSRENFQRLFPGETGTRVLLVDAPPGRLAAVERELRFALADHGLELETTAARLARFSVVQNTYLDIFLVLGGLGVLLGCVGLGVVVMRNVQERARELALLRALGFSRRQLLRLLRMEHMLLVFAGIGIGVGAGMMAVLPALARVGHAFWTGLPLWVAASSGIVSWLVVRLATTASGPGRRLRVLQQERGA